MALLLAANSLAAAQQGHELPLVPPPLAPAPAPPLPPVTPLLAPGEVVSQPTINASDTVKAAGLTDIPANPVGGQIRSAQGMPYGRPNPREERESEGQQIEIDLSPPGPEKLFRLESEASWKERLQQRRRRFGSTERLIFPEEPVISKEVYAGRAWPRSVELAEPNYVCYRRLHFQQLNLERYGWNLGFITPLVSAATFYWDVTWLPYNAFTDPCRCHDCNRGYCLPGDPTPLLLYPPHLSASGAAAEAAAITGVLFLFP